MVDSDLFVMESEEEGDLWFIVLLKECIIPMALINPKVIRHTSICSFYLLNPVPLNFIGLMEECSSLVINILFQGDN